MQPKKRVHLYKNYWHALAVVGILAVPFLFMLVFSQAAHLGTAMLLSAMTVSLFRMIIAYFVAVVLGWILAASFYHGRRAYVALPIFDVLQSFPTYAALPLAVVVWGASSFTVIFFLVLAIIWPIFFSVLSSLKLIKHDWEEAVAMMRLPRWVYFKKFLWPVSIPGLITGSIVGLGDGWEALVATEIIVQIKSGLGTFFQSVVNRPYVTGFGILGFLLLIFSINKIVWLPLMEWSHRLMEE